MPQDGDIEDRTPPFRRKRDRRAQIRIPREDIARRAYELYEARGGEPGHDVDDWLRAERELREKSKAV
jgi:Protein of unknown function (DUF2934)